MAVFRGDLSLLSFASRQLLESGLVLTLTNQSTDGPNETLPPTTTPDHGAQLPSRGQGRGVPRGPLRNGRASARQAPRQHRRRQAPPPLPEPAGPGLTLGVVGARRTRRPRGRAPRRRVIAGGCVGTFAAAAMVAFRRALLIARCFVPWARPALLYIFLYIRALKPGPDKKRLRS